MPRIFHNGQELELVANQTIFDYADELKVRVPTSCGRNGDCHECVVQILKGMESLCQRTEAENFLSENYSQECMNPMLPPSRPIQKPIGSLKQ